MKKTLALALALVLAPWLGAQTVQITEGPGVVYADATSAVVKWSTNVPASSVVMYGTDPNNLNQRAQAPYSNTGAHEVKLTGLKPSTIYYVKVESGQAKGTGSNVAGEEILSFTTHAQSDQAASATTGTASGSTSTGTAKIVAGPIVQQTNDNSTTLWFLADSDNPANVQLRYGTDRNNMNQTANVTFAGREGTVNLTNLEPGKVYYFEIANAGTQTGEFETLAANYDRNQMRITHGPVIEYLDDDAAIIAWSTTRPSSTIVRYGTDPNNLNKQATAAWGSGTHRVRIGNLQPNTTYYFVVESSQAQGSGAVAKSDPAQFRTFERGAQAFKNPQPRIGK